MRRNCNVLLIGGSSTVGRHVARAFANSPRYRVTETYFRGTPVGNMAAIQLDATDPVAVMSAARSIRPDYIINFAALADVFLCERQPRRAHRLNVLAARHIAEACISVDAQMIQISSDYVFPGVSGPYKISDAPKPVNVYGSTKFEAEQICTSMLRDQVAVLRLAHVYDPSPAAVTTGMLSFDRLTTSSIDIPNDIITTPTNIETIPVVLQKLMESGASGVIHHSDRTRMTWYELAVSLARQHGFDISRIRGISAAEWRRADIRVSWPLNGGII